MNILVFLAFVFWLVPAAQASKTEAAPETVWDQLMQAQAYREIRAGSDYLDNKQYEKAIQEFSKAVLARPQEPSAHIMLGAAYYWSGQVERAQDEFREALRLDPKSAQAHLLMGIVYAWKGEARTAYSEFQQAAKLAPDRADIQMNMGSMEETFGQTQDALDHFRQAVLLDPKNPLYHFQLGTLYRRLERYEEAGDSMRQAIKQFGEFEDAMLELGAIYERQGRKAEAEDMFHKAVKLKPLDSVARLRFGRLLIEDGRTDKARDIYRDAFHLTPADAGGGLVLSVSFGGKPRAGGGGPSEEAPKPATPPGAAAEPKDPLDVLARNLERIPLNQDARLSIEMAIMPRPKLVKAFPREASSQLKRALEQAGKPPEAGAMGVKREFTLKSSSAQERQNQIKNIIEDLRSVAAKASPDSDVRMGMNLNFIKPAVSSLARGDAQETPKVSYQPRQVGNDLGLWVVGTGWMVLVGEVLPEPGEKPEHPDAADWWVTDGLGYAALGDSKSALGSFNRALQRDPNDELALLGRAVAFVEMGRDDEAIAAYRRLLEVNPKNKVARDGLAWLMRGPAK